MGHMLAIFEYACLRTIFICENVFIYLNSISTGYLLGFGNGGRCYDSSEVSVGERVCLLPFCAQMISLHMASTQWIYNLWINDICVR